MTLLPSNATTPYSITIPQPIATHPLFLGSCLDLALRASNSFDSYCALEDYLTRMALVDDLTARELELYSLIRAEFANSFT